MLAEIAKMEDLRHPNVMPLIGVHFDPGSGLSIVMPFMANGCLLDYLKRERNAIYLDDNAELDTVSHMIVAETAIMPCAVLTLYLPCSM